MTPQFGASLAVVNSTPIIFKIKATGVIILKHFFSSLQNKLERFSVASYFQVRVETILRVA